MFQQAPHLSLREESERALIRRVRARQVCAVHRPSAAGRFVYRTHIGHKLASARAARDRHAAAAARFTRERKA